MPKNGYLCVFRAMNFIKDYAVSDCATRLFITFKEIKV